MVAVLMDAVAVSVMSGDITTPTAGVVVLVVVTPMPAVVAGVTDVVELAARSVGDSGVNDMVAVALMLDDTVGVGAALVLDDTVGVGVGLMLDDAAGVWVSVGAGLRSCDVAGIVGVSAVADTVLFLVGVAELSAAPDIVGVIVASATTLAVADDSLKAVVVMRSSGDVVDVPAGVCCAVADPGDDTVTVTSVSVATPVALTVGDGVEVWSAVVSGDTCAPSAHVAEAGGVAVTSVPPELVGPEVDEAVTAVTVVASGNAVPVAGVPAGDDLATTVAVLGWAWCDDASGVVDGDEARSAVSVEAALILPAATAIAAEIVKGRTVAVEVAVTVALGRPVAVPRWADVAVGGVPSARLAGEEMAAIADGVAVAVAVIVGETGSGNEAQFASSPASMLFEITL
jgi:hypothetical protein